VKYSPRNKYKKDLIIGIHAVEEAVKSGHTLRKVFFQRDIKNEKSKEILRLLKEHNIPVNFVPMEKLNNLSNSNHQGIIALSSPIDFADIRNIIPSIFETGKSPFVVILDNITDVRNFGSIVRSAQFLGVNAIIVSSKGSADINEETIKASSGALLKMDICMENDLVKAVHYLKSSGLQIIGAKEKADQIASETDFNLPTALILGSESEGISMDLLRYIDGLVSIPMLGDFDSLNVSVAAGILFYEATKQRNHKV
jgi:23S rRNA (guanosine2251-2'-O)-methyltransferase